MQLRMSPRASHELGDADGSEAANQLIDETTGSCRIIAAHRAENADVALPVSLEQAPLNEPCHHCQHRRVRHRPLQVQLVVNLAHRAALSLPHDVQDRLLKLTVVCSCHKSCRFAAQGSTAAGILATSNGVEAELLILVALVGAVVCKLAFLFPLRAFCFGGIRLLLQTPVDSVLGRNTTTTAAAAATAGCDETGSDQDEKRFCTCELHWQRLLVRTTCRAYYTLSESEKSHSRYPCC